MSLVSEALRKARQEAAERGAKQRGMVFRTTVVLGSDRARLSLGWVVTAVVVAAALSGAGIAWWLIPGRARSQAPTAQGDRPPAAAASARLTPMPSPSTAPPAAAPSPGAAPAIPEGEDAERRTSAVAAATARPGAAPHGHATIAAPADGTSAAARDATVISGPPSTPRPETDANRGHRSEPSAESRERSFVLDADLGRVKFHLDFIVYRSKGPFAEINGQEVVIGSIIEGFTVEEIDPDAVHLRDARGIVVLRTH